MKRTVLDTNTGLIKTDIINQNGECTSSAFTKVPFEICELNTIKVDTDRWYVITETLAEGIYVIERIFELDVLDDYLITKQCEELNEGDM
jgi:hypothetical protein